MKLKVFKPYMMYLYSGGHLGYFKMFKDAEVALCRF